MKSYLDCIPCFMRQTLDAIRRITDDESIQESVLRTILLEASQMDLNEPPPRMGQKIHRLIRKKTGVSDPYEETKRQSNQEVLSLYQGLRSIIDDTDESIELETAFRLAIAGNIIDLGTNSHIHRADIQKGIDQALVDPFYWDHKEILKSISQAHSILYIADNAGEIVFDRLLIERLPKDKITVAVRGFPVLNDATRFDAEETGLTSLVHVIDTGSDAPGILLEECSDEFLHHFNNADLIMAKGQGNYETLSDLNRKILFILKAKCPVIARHIGCQVGDMILTMNRSPATIQQP